MGGNGTTVLGRRLLLAGGAAAPLARPSAVRAQTTLVDKAVRLIVGSIPAGGEDKMARSIAPRLETRIGRHVTVDTKPSVTGATAGEALVRGPKDGSVIAFIGSATLAGKLTDPDYPFDPLKDITPVTIAGETQTGLAVAASTGVATFANYLEWMKAGGPERRKVGNTACPAFAEAFGRVFEQKIGGKIEPVTYRGAPPMLHDLANGRLPACMTEVTSLLEHHRGPRLKIVLSSAPERSRLAANVPTARELGYPALEVPEWYAFFVSSGVGASTVEEWNRHLAAVVADGEVKAELTQLGLLVSPTSVADAAPIVANYLQQWKKRLDLLGIKQQG
jgi:tripartite-type tricarboxylate transporter receptor subunit TctC